MSNKTYYRFASFIFAIIAVAHILRAVYELEATVAGVPVPIWFSWAAAIIALYLSIRGCQLAMSIRSKASKTKRLKRKK